MIDHIAFTVELIQFIAIIYLLGIVYSYSRFLNTETRIASFIFAVFWPFYVVVWLFGELINRVFR